MPYKLLLVFPNSSSDPLQPHCIFPLAFFCKHKDEHLFCQYELLMSCELILSFNQLSLGKSFRLQFFFTFTLIEKTKCFISDGKELEMLDCLADSTAIL